VKSLLQRPPRSSGITKNIEGLFNGLIASRGRDDDHHRIEITKRRKFILKLAKALLAFGAPSHRIESQLLAASNILDAQAGLSPSRYLLEISSLNEYEYLQNSFTSRISS